MGIALQQFVLPTALSRVGIIGRIALILGSLSMERAYRVEIHEHKDRRSGQQNRYLWGVCYATICRHLQGWDAEEVHEYMLGEHFGWERLEGLGRVKMRPLRRSSRLNKQEFAEYIEFVQRKAAEHGIFIPDADPDYWQHSEERAA